MSEAIAFDTHRFVKRLTACGFTERQAETLAEEHVALLNANLATKADIARVEAGVETLRQQTRADIEVLRQETKADIARVEAGVEKLQEAMRAEIAAAKAGLLKWLFGAPIVQGGLIVALVKVL